MNRQIIDDFSALNSKQFNANPGSLNGLYFLFTGTNDTGQTGALSDLGTVVIKRFGDETHNAKIERFAEQGNINRGSNYFTSTETGAFTAIVFVPFYEESFPQALQIRENNELNVQYQKGASGVFTALNCTVYASLAELKEYYKYYALSQDFTVSSAVSNRPEPLNTINISSLYLKSSVLTDVQLRVDGNEFISNQSFDMVKGATLFENRLEQSTIDTGELMIHTPGVPASTINQNSVLGVTTSGSGTVELLVCSVEWN